jgi:hypothetical protein
MWKFSTILYSNQSHPLNSFFVFILLKHKRKKHVWNYPMQNQMQCNTTKLSLPWLESHALSSILTLRRNFEKEKNKVQVQCLNFWSCCLWLMRSLRGWIRLKILTHLLKFNSPPFYKFSGVFDTIFIYLNKYSS